LAISSELLDIQPVFVNFLFLGGKDVLLFGNALQENMLEDNDTYVKLSRRILQTNISPIPPLKKKGFAIKIW